MKRPSRPKRYASFPLFLVGFFLVLSYPSKSIKPVSFIAFEGQLRTPLVAGNPLILTTEKNILRVLVDGEPAEPIGAQKWLSAIDLYRQNEVQIMAFEAPLPRRYADQIQVAWLPIQSRDLGKARDLPLPANVWEKVADPQTEEIRREEAQAMRAILAEHSPGPIQLCFQAPLKSKIVSAFASPRRPPNGQSYFHSGTDLRAATGTPIRAAAAGKVVLSKPMIVPGETIVIDHGRGLFSRYLHLSRRYLLNDDKVERGQIIGLSGATGRVQAPHLHWEVIFHGRPTDPMQFLNLVGNGLLGCG